MNSMGDSDATHLTLLLRLRDREDAVSWQEFHERYGQLLYRYARRRGAEHADAEDVVQEVEMYLFKALDGFQYDARRGRFRAYLRAAVIHAMGRRASREARQPADLDPRQFEGLIGQNDDHGDEQWEREWQLHRLRWALRSIAPQFEPGTLKAFEMHVLGGRAAEETAQLLDMSRDSIYQSKSRILKALKLRLAELDPEGDL